MMKAEAIRKQADHFTELHGNMSTTEKQVAFALSGACLALYEIAAQLAELNERLRQAQGPHWLNTFHVTTHAETGGDKRNG
jgi:gamma-glutamyl:cysteine ligase YbdK (ATP-grasp superfamily)